ncbi:putative metallocarboxypeptidase ecm14 [Hypsizygus marmoreus]|uniref:Inactive metallocarboxypeptidase ECM14 n=1 Tax=Hypsizygus marmoreus TaxID=39966 RepID=A0A369J7S8_HYPMA|nr:putative metallocarboxypeptidase ecm14 [Hypsizygus marmoreus]
MCSRLRYLTGVASILLLAAVRADSVENQYYLNVPQRLDSEPLPVGELWRFDVHDDSEIVKQVLAIAEEHDLDLWQVSHSHVDVYSPYSGPGLPPPLHLIPHTRVANITAPERTTSSRKYDEWDLNSLQNTTYHAEYHPLYEVDTFMRDLVAIHPDRARILDLGHSGMGREMMGIAISSGPSSAAKGKGRRRGTSKKSQKDSADSKLAFVIVGAQHAREWVATATSLYLAHALASNQSEPHSLAPLLNVFDFYIIPAPNPDGYDYTWETDRYWYKTRQRMGSKNKCFGLDMNRNWGYKWKPRADQMTAHSTSDSEDKTLKKKKRPREPTDPCSHWYPGHRPFEAPEVNNIANLIITIPNIVGFLDLRSYGQMLSAPFSYSCRIIPKDAEDQLEAGLGAARALGVIHGTQFSTGRLCAMLYRAPGNIVDWMYKRAGIKYSYVVHLRDTGTYGFSLPSKWIRPVGEETTEMLRYLATFIAKKMKREL